ncbi:MAG: hypothetical protein WC154_09110, partial [Candidatus Izemoplasmatales bacterium]
DKAVVCELIQHDFNEKRLKKEMDKIIYDLDSRTKMMNQYNELETILGKGGASAKTAQSIYHMIQSK